MQVFDLIYNFFNFINSILSTIQQAIDGIILIISSLFNLMLVFARILPYPLYPTFLAFLWLYLVVFSYKLIRKG